MYLIDIIIAKNNYSNNPAGMHPPKYKDNGKRYLVSKSFSGHLFLSSGPWYYLLYL